MSDWLIPYLSFNGNCEEAVKFYQKVLGGEAQILHFKDAPPNPNFPMQEHLKDLVLHAELKKDGHVIRFSDTFPGVPFNPGNTIAFSVEFDTKEETETVFKGLSEGGKVEMELQHTFFSPLYGKFTDKYGISWQISCSSHS
jgi:PhnB protein